MNTLLRNADDLQALRRDGVVKIPFLNWEELDAIRTFYHDLHAGDNPSTMYDGIHMTIWHHDLEYKLRVSRKLAELTDAVTQRTFTDFRAISQQYIVKKQGAETTFPIHQDWSIVDETKYPSFNLWIPLQDVDEDNGAMWIVKGSHNLDKKIRGAGHLFPNYYPVLDRLKPHMTSYPMKAGEALLFYHSTIHGSPYNRSVDPRIVIQISILPKEAPLQIFFQKTPEDPLEVHEPDDDFVFNYRRIREDSPLVPPSPEPKEVWPPHRPGEITFSEVMAAITPVKKPLFKSGQLQSLLDQDGILRTPFMPPADVAQLREVFDSLHPVRNSTMDEAYYFSVFGPGKTYMREIYERCMPILKPHLDNLFENYKVSAVLLQVKGVGDGSSVNLHQDLTVTDESRYNTCTVWIPLMDSTLRNGAISVLPGSQRAFRSFRAHTVDDYAFSEVEDFIRENAATYTATAGEALVFDPAAIHYSGPNHTDTPRISVAVSVVDAEAPLHIGFHDKSTENDDLELFDVPDNFWYLYDDFATERGLRPAFGTYRTTLKNAVLRGYEREDFIDRYRAVTGYTDDKALLREPGLDKELRENGYVKIPFADKAVTARLLDLFDGLTRHRTDIPADVLYTCLHNTEKTFVHDMDKGLREILLPLIERVFHQFSCTSFTYQVKGTGEKSELFAHQDWSFTDEKHFRTYTFWLTLHDSFPGNGTVYVLPKSHRHLTGIRGAGIDSVFDEVREEAKKSMVPVNVKAGELLLFDSALAHFSPPNHTREKRVSVMTNITNHGAGFMLYFGKRHGDLNEIDGYRVSDDFLLRYENFKSDYTSPPPGAVYQGTRTADGFRFTKESFAAFLRRPDFRGDGWAVRLKKRLGIP